MNMLAPLWPHSRTSWLWLVGIVLAALLLFLPLRLALGIAGAGDSGVTARAAGGTIWSGRLIEARLGPLGLGTLDTSLRPLPLLLGRLRFDVDRIGGAPLRGSLETGWGRRGLHDLSGSLSGSLLGDMPVEQVNFDALTVLFEDGRCAEASGRVRLVLGLDMAGVSLRNGLSGNVRCDDGALLLPLIGDSGVERLMLRVDGEGRYTGALGTGSASSTLRIEGRL